MNKRILSVLLVLVMLMSLFPTTVLAAGDRNEQIRIMPDGMTVAAPAEGAEEGLPSGEDSGDEPAKQDETYAVDEDADPVELLVLRNDEFQTIRISN